MPDAIAETAALFQQEIAPGSNPPAKAAGGGKLLAEDVFPHLSESAQDEDPKPKSSKGVNSAADVDEDFLDQLDETGGTSEAGDDAGDDDDDQSGDGADDADEEDDEDDEGKEDDEDGEDEDPIMKKKFAVTVDGDEVEVTLKEALNGYIRTETLHQRLNKLEEVKTGLRTEAQTILSARNDMIAQLEETQKIYETAMPAEPDWDALYKENPGKARALEKSFRDVKAKIDDIKAKTQKAREEQAVQQAIELQKFADSEFPKFAQRARWKDQKHAQKDLTSMKRTALNAGFSEEEAGSVVDSRMLLILLKASKYDRMVSNKPRPVNVPGNGARQKSPGAGNGQSRTAPKALVKAQRQHERRGSIETAAGIFEQQLALERRSKRRG